MSIFKKILKNSQGSSLVQVLVIGSMVSIFSLGVMEVSKRSSSLDQFIRYDENINSLNNRIKNLFTSQNLCARNIFISSLSSRSNFTALQGTPVSLNGIINDSGATIYEISTTTQDRPYFGTARIQSISLNNFRVISPLVGIANLRIQYWKQAPSSTGTNALGGKYKIKNISLRIHFDGATPNRCYLTRDNDTANLKQEACENLGGSFSPKGHCHTAEYQHKEIKKTTSTKVTQSICEKLRTTYDPVTEQCIPYPLLSFTCPNSGENLTGFTATGEQICSANRDPCPAGTRSAARPDNGDHYCQPACPRGIIPNIKRYCAPACPPGTHEYRAGCQINCPTGYNLSPQRLRSPDNEFVCTATTGCLSVGGAFRQSPFFRPGLPRLYCHRTICSPPLVKRVIGSASWCEPPLISTITFPPNMSCVDYDSNSDGRYFSCVNGCPEDTHPFGSLCMPSASSNRWCPSGMRYRGINIPGHGYIHACQTL